VSGADALAGDSTSREQSLDQLLGKLSAVKSYEGVAVSPDGKAVTWVQVERTRPDAITPDKKIYVLQTGSDPGAPRRIHAGKSARSEHAPAWSPDSKGIAFLAERDKEGQSQLYVSSASGNEPRRLGNLEGALAQPRWSPDGKLLAVLHTEGALGPTGPVAPAQPEVGEVGATAPAQRLVLLDVASGRRRAISPEGLHIHEYDWSPDSKELVAVASAAPGDCNWYVAKLCAISAATGKVRDILEPTMQIAVPRWSPDGKTIAFIGGLMSDEGANGGDLLTVPAAGGKAVNHTPGLKASASWLSWLPSSRRIVFAEHVAGSSGIAALDLDGDRVTTLWTGPETIAAQGWGPALSMSHDGTMSALARHSFQRPPEVWSGPIGKWKQITSGNGGVEPSWGKAESLQWKSESWQVQGWLLYPRDYDAGKRYPLLVSVHGGPASAKRPAWPGSSDLAVLAHEGYFVFFPNPRGSFGQGEAFTRANVKDFGHGDLRDILSGVDAVLKHVPVDANRLAIAGWSYGGYMTMWAVTQTTRFRAAVAGAGIANWQSYYGQNGIDQWLLPYFGATVYDDPAVYARSSPIEFITRVRTPTLVLVGERDAECPPPQSREFWHALKTRKVPTQLVIYPGEGHGFRSPRHRCDVMRRTLRWLDRYLQPGGGAPEASKGR
jgi:dipeptidyl aminopeptidase/acylaminoacyl peptidase